MTQLAPPDFIHPEGEAIADYRRQARIFLARSREYLAVDDLHQASEKGWAAAAWMTKAVATAQGWEYERHGQFFPVMRRCEGVVADGRFADWWPAANLLHEFFYTRRVFLDPEMVGQRIDQVAAMLDLLEPLTRE